MNILGGAKNFKFTNELFLCIKYSEKNFENSQNCIKNPKVCLKNSTVHTPKKKITLQKIAISYLTSGKDYAQKKVGVGREIRNDAKRFIFLFELNTYK